jgi:thioredoxin 1
VDANQEFAAKYGVRNIPTVLIFHNGEVVGKQVGVAPKQTYADSLDAVIMLLIIQIKGLAQQTFFFCFN